jgi:hypothetical protein
MHALAPIEAKSTSESSRFERHGRQAPEDESAERACRAIRCGACGIPLASATDESVVAGQHEHSFINPQGYIYHVRCFTAARNVSALGSPSSEFTWFPGHTWWILNCAACGVHVGWRFDSQASYFFALIADRIDEDVAGGA